MAYFPNGTSGMVFSDQCAQCRYGEGPCPIFFVQYEYNYKACNNEVARAILDALVKDDGTCEMFKLDPKRFAADEPETPAQENFMKVLDEISGAKP